MSHPWAPAVMESFSFANHPNRADDQSAFNGSYNRLLWHLFNVAGPYEVIPPMRVRLSSPYASEGAYETPFTIELNHRPVFFVDVQSTSYIELDSNKRQADARMRDYFRDFREQVVTPYLHGVSAFGTRLRFYKYTLATNTLEPAAIPADQTVPNDLVPAPQWDCDLLDIDGAARFREVVESVFQMCQASERK